MRFLKAVMDEKVFPWRGGPGQRLEHGGISREGPGTVRREIRGNWRIMVNKTGEKEDRAEELG